MLAGEYRLQGTHYIKRAKEKGKLSQFDLFGVSVFKRVKSGMDKPTQFAFVISTKVAKHAVDRNRIKRMMTEAIRFEANHLRNGFDVVFLVKKSIYHQPTEIVMRQTKMALKKLKLLAS